MTYRSHVFDRHDEYGLNIRVAAIAALVMVIGCFLFVRQPEVKPYRLRSEVPPFVLEPLPSVINPPANPPAVQKPAVPIPARAGEPAESTVGPSIFREFDRVDEPLPELKPVPFWKVEKKPVLRFEAVPRYPELAVAAGIEGKVVVEAVVDTSGEVVEPRIYQSSGNQLLDQAALDAVVKFKFTPGYQLDRPVPVLIQLPFKFELH
ncbi:MAG: energy transducer TonB [candidate division WOR-3 bacterium]